MAQFKTVQDYADWTVQSFSLTIGLHDFRAIVPDVNFDRFRTIEEFDATWLRVRRLMEDTPDVRANSLPTGQPKGVTAFADAASPYPTHGRRKFMPRELFPTGYVGVGGVWAVVTTDKQADGQHICFTRRWGRPGISVANAIERLTTTIYREESAKQVAPDPSRLHFYEHITPASSGEFKESFARVALSFEDGEFRKPRWQLHYPVIPKAIRSARFGLALIEAMAITELSR